MNEIMGGVGTKSIAPAVMGARLAAVAGGQHDELFALLVDSVIDYAIFMLDPQGRILTWNAGAERIKGYRSEQIVGRHFSAFYTREDVARQRFQYGLDIAAARGRFEDEGLRVRRDGTTFWANVVITALHDEAGTLCGFAKITRDLSERRQAEEQLYREIAQRRAAEIELRDLAADLESLVAGRTAELEAANSELQRQVAERKRIATQMAAAKARLQTLSAQLLMAQEAERGALSRKLHDEFGQALITVIMLIHGAGRQERGAGEGPHRECLALLENTLYAVRDLSVELRPMMLHELGLAPALEAALARHARAAGWKEDFAADAFPARLEPEIESVCFRIAQEALTNSARHAHATRVGVRLRLAGAEIELTVRDDGTGFEPGELLRDVAAPPTLGLISMKERAMLAAGRLEIIASHGAGTEVRATFPAHWRS